MTDGENPFAELFKPPPFASIAELMTADAAGSLSDDDFLRHLNWFLAGAIETPADCAGLPEPVVTYWAATLMEGDVLNGGFAQAAYNIPDWFELSAQAYERLGRPQAAERIRRAAALAISEADSVNWLKRRRAEIRAVFNHFRASSLSALNEGLYEIGWDVTAERLALARQHRDAFAQVAAPP